MWTDQDTSNDFLNFSIVAKASAELISSSNLLPLSLGVYGNWGVGKSSMIKLIKKSLLKTPGEEEFIFVDFNAWLYQGYDDAKAALMDVIAQKLSEEAKGNETLFEKVKDLAKKVTSMRVLGIAAAFGSLYLFPKGKGKALMKGGEELGKLIEEISTNSPPKEIQEFRDTFSQVLKDINKTLVVFIDDLDRCLPNVAIETLEAVRLFLFMDQAAFVVAADQGMIRQSVKKHFDNLEELYVEQYLDKLIQIPVRVPLLGLQEIRAYMMLLFLQNSGVSEDSLENIRGSVCEKLSKAWKNERVTRESVLDLLELEIPSECPPQLRNQLEIAESLAPFMASSKNIAANPRLVKRFMNTLMMRTALAKAQGIAANQEILAKILLFERCAGDKAYADLVITINSTLDGKPDILQKLEDKVLKGEDITADLPETWNSTESTKEFVIEWLHLNPPFGEMDLRPYIYVSRENIPFSLQSIGISEAAQGLLTELLALGSPNPKYHEKIETILSIEEQDAVMGRLLDSLRKHQDWKKTPKAWGGAITLADFDPRFANRLGALLGELAPKSVGASISIKLQGREWAEDILNKWESEGEDPLKKAIASSRKKKRKENK